ncbi:MAG: cytochrome c, partial [Solirubrobacterales bacterium]|nr:cytochrome c [Solirubrobacterales bacterium]
VSNRVKTNGPNFNVRKENVEQVLYAIRNGGFSGAIMPENVVVGPDAQAVAEFLAKYSGLKSEKVPSTNIVPSKE